MARGADLLTQSSAAMVATAELALAEPEWDRFRSVLADAAAEDGWALRDGSDRRALGGSLRSEAAQVSYRQWAWAHPPETRATLFVVAPRGGEGWKGATEALFRRLAREWPGALVVNP